MGAKRHRRSNGSIAPPCIVEGCEKPGRKRKMCTMHYQRWFFHGDATYTGAPTPRTNADGGDYIVGMRADGTQEWMHILVAEKALGKRLPKGVQVHHVDEGRSDNSPGNLVICPNAKYHRLLHIRTSAYNATGNANARKCMRCHKYDSPGNLTEIADGRHYHNECNNEFMRRYKAAKRGIQL